MLVLLVELPFTEWLYFYFSNLISRKTIWIVFVLKSKDMFAIMSSRLMSEKVVFVPLGTVSFFIRLFIFKLFILKYHPLFTVNVYGFPRINIDKVY